jgi:hypothetical protein
MCGMVTSLQPAGDVAVDFLDSARPCGVWVDIAEFCGRAHPRAEKNVENQPLLRSLSTSGFVMTRWLVAG